MKPSQLINLLVSRFKAGIKRPVHAEGPPGIGKTQIAAQAAKELGVDFKVIHAPLLQPEDYGFPVITKERDNVNFIVSSAKFPVENSDCGEAGIFLIDELPQADNSAQKILRNLIQEREIHGQRIKKGWSIITTGNRATDRAGANRLLSHLSNVLTRVELEVSIDDWTQWALANSIKTEVIAFIRFRPALLSAFDAQNEVNATPRAWAEGVSATLGQMDPALEFETFKGDVGEGAAAEFIAFLKIFRKLPNPDTILMNPTKADVPTGSDAPAIMYALCGALAHKTTEANFTRVMSYISRLPGEFGILFMNDLVNILPAIQHTKDFQKWFMSSGAKLLT